MTKLIKILLISAVFAALLMLFKFGVVEPAYTLKHGNPPLYGEMFYKGRCIMRIFAAILFCLFIGGCVPTTGLVFVNNSSSDLILSLMNTDNSYVLLEKYNLPQNHQHNALQVQGVKCTLLLETKHKEKYVYQFQAKDDWKIYTVMYVVIMPDMSLYLVDSISELQTNTNGSHHLLPTKFVQ